MSHNPYASPSAEVLDFTAAKVRTKWPVTLLLFQVLGYALMVATAVGMFSYLSRQPATAPKVVLVASSTPFLLLLAYLATAVLCIHSRRRVGGYLAALLLGLIVAIALLNSKGPGAGPSEYVLGWYAGTFGTCALLLLWAYAVAFSAKARRFFGTASTTSGQPRASAEA
jgi:hypothetical protein